ncbi:hypothetical protein PybrP1_001056, partial [[Pythium] brassicae (nom. inval.)]
TARLRVQVGHLLVVTVTLALVHESRVLRRHHLVDVEAAAAAERAHVEAARLLLLILVHELGPVHRHVRLLQVLVSQQAWPKLRVLLHDVEVHVAVRLRPDALLRVHVHLLEKVQRHLVLLPVARAAAASRLLRDALEREVRVAERDLLVLHIRQVHCHVDRVLALRPLDGRPQRLRARHPLLLLPCTTDPTGAAALSIVSILNAKPKDSILRAKHSRRLENSSQSKTSRSAQKSTLGRASRAAAVRVGGQYASVVMCITRSHVTCSTAIQCQSRSCKRVLSRHVAFSSRHRAPESAAPPLARLHSSSCCRRETLLSVGVVAASEPLSSSRFDPVAASLPLPSTQPATVVERRSFLLRPCHLALPPYVRAAAAVKRRCRLLHSRIEPRRRPLELLLPLSDVAADCCVRAVELCCCTSELLLLSSVAADCCVRAVELWRRPPEVLPLSSATSYGRVICVSRRDKYTPSVYALQSILWRALDRHPPAVQTLDRVPLGGLRLEAVESNKKTSDLIRDIRVTVCVVRDVEVMGTLFESVRARKEGQESEAPHVPGAPLPGYDESGGAHHRQVGHVAEEVLAAIQRSRSHSCRAVPS